jgi:uncharacterized membrane protein
MENTMFDILVWTLALSSGLMAGTYFAFSGFIMRAFDSLEAGEAVAAMNAINRVILKSAFMPLFFLSTLAGLMLAGMGLWQWGAPGSGLAILAGAIYVIGMFVTTAAVNVPLNNALVGSDNDPAAAWRVYLARWTRWNTSRALASTTAMVLCIALVALP